jgi:hypothetical protein
MKTIIFCATALTMTGATMAAGSDWTTLDREVEALSSSLSPQGGGVAISGYLDLGYTSTDIGGNWTTGPGPNPGDPDVDVIGDDQTVGDFGGNNLRLGFSAENSGYGITVGLQLATADGVDVTDAYVTTDVGGMNGTAGRFKSPMGASGGRAERNQFFQDRSAIGSNFAGRSSGIMVGGAAGAINWAVAIQDGDDDLSIAGVSADVPIGRSGDEYRTTLHVNYAVMGMGSSVEGCYGAGDGMGLVIGASMTDNGADGSDSSTVIDASLTSGTFSFSAEFADYGGSSTGPGASLYASSETLGESPMALAATYMVGSDWEIGVRHQELDTADGATDLDIAVNYYVSGHDVKYTFGYSMEDNDNDNAAEDTLTVGFQIGF